MSEPFLGMVATVPYNFPPRGWADCSGQLLAIQQNTALFALLGTQYGGNGQTTFALPDLRGRSPIGVGQGPGLSPISQGQAAGTETTTLTTTQLAAHNHTAAFSGTGSAVNAIDVDATTQAPTTGYQLARARDGDGTPDVTPWIYAPAAPENQVALGGLNVAGTVTNAVAGASQPLPIRDPYLAIRWIIATSGIFPSRN